MNHTLASRAMQIKPSATIAVTAQAAHLQAQGRDIIALAAGQPDFDTPEPIREAAIAAIHQGQTQYTAVAGTEALRQAICGKLKRDNGLDFGPDQLLVSNGAKQALFNLLLAVLNEGDEVLIPTPSWVSYVDMVALVGAVPVTVAATQAQAFKPSLEQWAAAMTPATRLVILNSPCNPTGQVYNQQELTDLGELLRQHPHILIASDEIYEAIYWGDEPLGNLLTFCPDLADRYVLINGVSKSYAMTGWRIGYAAGPRAVIEAMIKIQGQTTTSACSISQAAATAALNGDQACVQQMVHSYKRRHDDLYRTLQELNGVSCLPSLGTFYLFLSVAEVLRRDDQPDDDVGLAMALLEQAELALVPGSAFGADGYLRLSFTQDQATLERAVTRLRRYLS